MASVRVTLGLRCVVHRVTPYLVAGRGLDDGDLGLVPSALVAEAALVLSSLLVPDILAALVLGDALALRKDLPLGGRPGLGQRLGPGQLGRGLVQPGDPPLLRQSERVKPKPSQQASIELRFGVSGQQLGPGQLRGRLGQIGYPALLHMAHAKLSSCAAASRHQTAIEL